MVVTCYSLAQDKISFYTLPYGAGVLLPNAEDPVWVGPVRTGKTSYCSRERSTYLCVCVCLYAKSYRG